VNVIYTGRTLGYLRSPDKQTPKMLDCTKDEMNAAASEFVTVLKGRKDSESIVVGMGDNFSPELDARAFDGFPSQPAGKMPGKHQINADQQIPHPGKDLFSWDSKTQSWLLDFDESRDLMGTVLRHQATIPADNVGCFFRLAGYDAIVPGKHDFEAGPEHVITMARFLRSTKGTGSDDQSSPVAKSLPPTAMLGANLAIVTSAPDAKPRLPLYQIEHDLEADQKKSLSAHLAQYSVIFPRGRIRRLRRRNCPRLFSSG